ncbi:MAG: ABC transporter permease subunit [Planctomycetota bacterium]|jgi:ABC-type transport system involved in multi-copper enzyme maturation permease subunit
MVTIIKREILEHVQSLQFVILIVLSILLFGMNGWVTVKKHREQMSQYNHGISEMAHYHSTTRTTLHMRPSAMVLLADGGSKHQPPGYRLEPKGRLTPLPAGQKNFKMPFVPELDWAFIIKAIFSLYAILLAFRGISGEKEVGTLRLVLSYALRRNQVLLAKYISILLTIGIPLILGSLISLCIVSIFMPVALSLNIIPRIGLMVLLAFFYLSIFAFLGLLISSLVGRSSVVLLILLAAWILLVIVVPNLSGILSDKLTDVPSEYQTAKEVSSILKEQVWGRIDKVKERVKRGELTTEEAIKAETDRAFEEGQKKVRNHYAVYDNAMKRRANMARTLSRLSPTGMFQFASESLADTGPRREERFLKDAKTYSETYDNYILEKLGRLVGVSHWSFSTSMTVNGKHIYISSPHPEEYQGDKSDFPQFAENSPNLAYNVQEAALDLAGLSVWNLVFAGLAFWAISRCDVR